MVDEIPDIRTQFQELHEVEKKLKVGRWGQTRLVTEGGIDKLKSLSIRELISSWFAVKRPLSKGKKVESKDPVELQVIARSALQQNEGNVMITPVLFGVAVDAGNRKTLRAMLVRGDTGQLRAEDYNKALMLAAATGDMQLLEAVKNNGDVNCKNDSEETPLMLACKNGHQKMVAALLFRGAAMSSLKDKSNSPGVQRLLDDHKQKIKDALFVKGELTQRDSLQWLKILPKADIKAYVNEKDPANSRTPLMVAAQRGDEKAVEYFISCGADVSAMDEYEATALTKAVHGENIKCIECLAEQATQGDITKGLNMILRKKDDLYKRASYLEKYRRDTDGELVVPQNEIENITKADATIQFDKNAQKKFEDLELKKLKHYAAIEHVLRNALSRNKSPSSPP